MTHTVVITLQTEHGFCRDFELPTHVPMKELCIRLLAVLQKFSSNHFSEWTSLELKTSEGLLSDPDATLNDYGVCTGYYLTAIPRKKDDDG